MRTASSRPSIWHLIVTLVAMFYLSCLSRGIANAEHSAGNSFTYNDPTVCNLTIILGILEALAWFFLLGDLIRQIALFFGIKFK